MKKTAIILVSLFFTGATFCQNYYPLPDSNVIWQGGWGTSGCFDFGWFDTYQYTVTGDTSINSIYYKIIERHGFFNYNAAPIYPHTGYLGAFRNDIGNKKVLIVPRDSLNEMVLYDFDLNIGDTITGYLDLVAEYNTAIISDIDSTLIANNYRKRWHYQSSGLGFYDGYIIEGIGCEYGFLEGLCAMMDYNGTLHCFSIGDQTLYPESGPGSCDLFTSVAEPENMSAKKIYCYPNPTNSEVQVSHIDLSNIHTYIIYDQVGRIIKRSIFGSSQIINLETVKNGIYYIEFLNNNEKTVNREKIIKY